MGFVNLREMAKRLKRTEEEVMTYVESGILDGCYSYPLHFGDGKEIAFRPERVLATIEEIKKKGKVEAKKEEIVEPAPEQKGESEPEQPGEEELPPEQPTEKTEGEKTDPFDVDPPIPEKIPKKGKKKK